MLTSATSQRLPHNIQIYVKMYSSSIGSAVAMQQKKTRM